MFDSDVIRLKEKLTIRGQRQIKLLDREARWLADQINSVEEIRRQKKRSDDVVAKLSEVINNAYCHLAELRETKSGDLSEVMRYLENYL